MQNKVRLRKGLKEVPSDAGRQTKGWGPEKKKTNGMEQQRTAPGYTRGGVWESAAERTGSQLSGEGGTSRGCGPGEETCRGHRLPSPGAPNRHKALPQSLAKLQDAHGPGSPELVKRFPEPRLGWRSARKTPLRHRGWWASHLGKARTGFSAFFTAR